NLRFMNFMSRLATRKRTTRPGTTWSVSRKRANTHPRSLRSKSPVIMLHGAAVRSARSTPILGRICVLFVLATLSVPFIPLPADGQLLRTEHGSLVVAVRWRLGIVVCADRRRLVEGDGKIRYRDDVLKIVPAPP